MYADRFQDDSRWIQLLYQESAGVFNDVTISKIGEYSLPQFRSDAITGDSVEVIDINGDGLLDLHFTHNLVNFNNQGRLEELFFINIC